MKAGRLATLRSIARAYRGCPAGARARVLVRYLTAPFERLLAVIPAEGRLLDVGCGDGLLLFLLSRQPGTRRECHGIDPAPGKIESARAVLPEPVKLTACRIADLPERGFDCISIVDVLYLMPRADWKALFSHCAERLAPGGLLVVKEVADRPRWKSAIALLQEQISIHLTRMTLGSRPHLEAPETYRREVEAAGFDLVEMQDLGKGQLHPHVLLIFRKNQSPERPPAPRIAPG